MKTNNLNKTGGGKSPSPISLKKSFRFRLKKDLKRNKMLYLMILPAVVFFFVFSYLPMGGLIIAFKNYSPVHGIFGSPWSTDLEGNLDIFRHFRLFFTDPYFGRLLKNTLIFSILDIIFVFPAPIILALFMNSIRNKPYRRTAQTLVYLPYFISMVVLCGMIFDFTSSTGFISGIFQRNGLIGESTGLLGDERYFRSIIVISNIWTATGYGSIIYIAALSSIDQTLYEAAQIDGAGKWKSLTKITIPSIMPIVFIFLLLKIATLLNYNFEKIHLLYSAPTYNVADIISTYIYRIGIETGGRLSYTTAIGLFNSVIGFVLLLISNSLVRRYSDSSLF